MLWNLSILKPQIQRLQSPLSESLYIPFIPLVSHQPVPLETQLVSDQGPPELLLLSEESTSRSGSGNDPASLESSNASSTIPLLPSLDAADAHSDSQNAHMDVQGTDLPARREALPGKGGGDMKECGVLDNCGEPSSSYAEVGQSDASSLTTVPVVSPGDLDAAQDVRVLSHPEGTIPQTLHLSSATEEGAEQNFTDLQQVCTLHVTVAKFSSNL